MSNYYSNPKNALRRHLAYTGQSKFTRDGIEFNFALYPDGFELNARKGNVTFHSVREPYDFFVKDDTNRLIADFAACWIDSLGYQHDNYRKAVVPSE